MICARDDINLMYVFIAQCDDVHVRVSFLLV